MPPKGQHWTEEQKAHLSAVRTGLKVSEETKAKIAAGQVGRVHTEESREKRRQKLTGRVFSDETIEKMRLAHIGQPGTRNGQHHTEEAKELLRVARLNQVHPSLSNRGITIEQFRAATEAGLRWCSADCKAFLPKIQFQGERATKCRKCNATYMHRNRCVKKFGITPERYEEMVIEQKGVCAICSLPQSVIGKRLAVDHDHSGTHGSWVRGLLCSQCNTALERLDAVPGWTDKALAYLARYKDAPQPL
jgi:Recombination endonuclease VII/NUMOD3 motif